MMPRTRHARSTLFIVSAAIAYACSAAYGGDAAVSATGRFLQGSTVVFVCEHGVSKSLVAAALFNRMAEQRGLPVRAISRAVDSKAVGARVPPRLVQKMTSDGFNIQTFRPQVLAATEAAHANRVVVIGYEGPVEAAADGVVERWEDVAPPSLEYESAKKAITSQIEVLLGRFDRRGEEPIADRMK